jgi:hypothetical protein
MTEHRRCPKEACSWNGAKDEKEKDRHVWIKHEKWAKESNYPSIGGACDICGKEYRRRDYVARHKREKHEGKKRHRK